MSRDGFSVIEPTTLRGVCCISCGYDASYQPPEIIVCPRCGGGLASVVPSESVTREVELQNDEFEQLANAMLDALLLIQSNERGESYSAGVAMSCIASMDERRRAYGRRGKVPRFLPTWLGGEADRISGPGVALTRPTLSAPPSPPSASSEVSDG